MVNNHKYRLNKKEYAALASIMGRAIVLTARWESGTRVVEEGRLEQVTKEEVTMRPFRKNDVKPYPIGEIVDILYTNESGKSEVVYVWPAHAMKEDARPDPFYRRKTKKSPSVSCRTRMKV